MVVQTIIVHTKFVDLKQSLLKEASKKWVCSCTPGSATPKLMLQQVHLNMCSDFFFDILGDMLQSQWHSFCLVRWKKCQNSGLTEQYNGWNWRTEDSIYAMVAKRHIFGNLWSFCCSRWETRTKYEVNLVLIRAQHGQQKSNEHQKEMENRDWFNLYWIKNIVLIKNPQF